LRLSARIIAPALALVLAHGLGCGGDGQRASADAEADKSRPERARRPPEPEGREPSEPPLRAVDAFEREMRLGDAAIYSGRFEEARKHFLRAMELRPESMSPALGAVRSMIIKGHAETRQEIAQRIRRRVNRLRAEDASRGSEHLLAARLALALGENGAALDAAYLGVLELPELGAAWRVLGEAAMADEH